LKKMIEDAFAARTRYKFTVVQTPQEANIIFRGDIVEYIWMKEDPIDEVYGIGAAAMDAAFIENYARIQIQSEIIDVKKNSVLWSDKVKATMTKKDMPIEESYALIYPKIIKSEVIEIFRKANQGVM
jgi:monomeric isocitrate dehydrogenase